MNKIIGIFIFILFFISGGCAMSEEQHERSYYVDGEIIIGFEKGITKEKAEGLLKQYKLSYEEPVEINISKGFFYDTGEKFLIKVPKGKEDYWVSVLKNEKIVKYVTRHINRDEVILD